MDPDRYEQSKRLFLAALRQPEPARAQFVAASAPSPGLRDHVLELLRQHEAAEAEGDGAEHDAAPFAPPERIGPFRILGVVGHGGMGVVYRARRGDEPPVALKVLEVSIASSRVLSRFRREAEALRRLDHPGIARFIEAGEFQSPLGPQPYFVMELVDAGSLRARAAESGWSPAARLAFLADLAEALHHAHEQGIVHRDIKPENVVVTPEGQPKILDFGVARITGADVRAGTIATGSGVLLGTIRYMSPEQAQGMSEIDRRSDVYALGVLAYELLSGTLPYALHTRSVTRALVQVATTPARPLGEVSPALRGPVERIVARALEKRPEDRYPTAAAMAADIRRHLAGRRIEAWGPTPLHRGLRLARRRPRAAMGAAAALVTLVVAAVLTAPARSPAAREARARAATARACALLDSVDVRLHLTTRTVESLERALALLAGARRAIARLGRRDYAADLHRYAAWREGEARYFLANLSSDPDGYLAAAEAWERSREPARPYDFRPALPDTTVRLYERLLGATPTQADGGRALAYADVARYRSPLFYSRLGRHHEEAAWATMTRLKGLDPDPLRTLPTPFRESDLGRALNGLGAALTATGFYGDTLRALDRGLQILIRADRMRLLLWDPPAYASLQHQLGRAWLWRARLRGEQANVDSAIARLEMAHELRTSFPANTSLFETHEALAEALRLRSRMVVQRERAGWIARAHETLREGVEHASRQGFAAHHASLALALAGARVDQALLARDTTALVEAVALLAAPARRFTRDRYPVQFAGLERERGRIAACHWVLTGDPESRVTAIQRFAGAGETLSRDHHVPFRVRLGFVNQWLARPRNELTFTSPVFAP